VRGRLSSSLASMAIDNEDGSSVLVAKGARRGGFYRGGNPHREAHGLNNRFYLEIDIESMIHVRLWQRG
jgi:hypothetical protein